MGPRCEWFLIIRLDLTQGYNGEAFQSPSVLRVAAFSVYRREKATCPSRLETVCLFLTLLLALVVALGECFPFSYSLENVGGTALPHHTPEDIHAGEKCCRRDSPRHCMRVWQQNATYLGCRRAYSCRCKCRICKEKEKAALRAYTDLATPKSFADTSQFYYCFHIQISIHVSHDASGIESTDCNR